MNFKDFNFTPIQGTGQCLGTFFSGLSSEHPWIIGDSFLKNVYSAFNYSTPISVGFAPITRSNFNTQFDHIAPINGTSTGRKEIVSLTTIAAAAFINILFLK